MFAMPTLPVTADMVLQWSAGSATADGRQPHEELPLLLKAHQKLAGSPGKLVAGGPWDPDSSARPRSFIEQCKRRNANINMTLI